MLMFVTDDHDSLLIIYGIHTQTVIIETIRKTDFETHVVFKKRRSRAKLGRLVLHISSFMRLIRVVIAYPASIQKSCDHSSDDKCFREYRSFRLSLSCHSLLAAKVDEALIIKRR